jgi:hypothetical protein
MRALQLMEANFWGKAGKIVIPGIFWLLNTTKAP